MTRKLLLLISFVLTGFAIHAQTSIAGSVTDEETGEPVMFANVALYRSGVLITGGQTDFDGNFNLSNIDPGTYDLEVSFVGYQTQRVNGILARAGQVNPVNVTLGTGLVLDEVVVTDYKVPLIEIDNTTSGGTITSEQIKKSPLKDVSGLASITAGVSSVDGGGDISIRGSRDNATDYYIDGIRVRANQIPQTEIEQLQVITGGIEAKYGDVTGGIISITTKGPSSKYTGGLEVETSKGLDPFGRLELNGNLSGPLIKKKSGESILGFRLAGRYLNLEDRAPSAVGVYRATEEQIARLSEDPFNVYFGQPVPEAELIPFSEIPLVQARPNEWQKSLDLNGKIDWRVAPGIDVSLTGGYYTNRSRFAPGRGQRVNGLTEQGTWGLFNHVNNPVNSNEGLRTNLRFRHRIGKTSSNTASGAAALIQNLTYTIQVGYETSNGLNQDWQHRDRLFDYGHIGSFSSTFDPVFDPDGFHVGFSPTLRNFDPFNSRNPVLARYNNPGDSPTQPYLNGLVDGTANLVYSIFHNVGGVYDNFSKSQTDIYTGSLAINFDLVPGGSSKGRHTIELGAWIEQREIRSWNANPFRLWNLAQQEVNTHLSGDDLDTTRFVDTVINGVNRRLFNLNVTDVRDKDFHKSFRNQFGIPIDEWVFLGEYDPSDLSLDMFSANQLIDPGFVSMFGYDYRGNKIRNIAFEDFYNYNFFGEENFNGQPSYMVAPDRPFYFAGYIQDKFQYKDIIFRIGLRLDAFDANTKVMRDPFSLYPIQNASDFHNSNATNIPSGIGDEFKVYVESEGSSSVKGYRRGNVWFDANGNQLNDGNFLFGGELVNPAYEPGVVRDIQSPEYDINRSFEDYRIRLNPMPRISISFPISDQANFFGSYDVLFQRPPGRNYVSPLDYYFYETRTPINNANLNPEQTINYEVGFQQKLTNSSAIKINAYYKELRDMIQRRYFLYLPNPVNENLGFDNIDFGTVKGFTFAYDLRRTGNVSLQANYTLQFADGTGSDDRSQEAILRPGTGNLRYLLPLNYDERHAFNFLFDLRWDGGSRYNGPSIGDFQLLANTGINIQSSLVSGRPYTRGEAPLRYGSRGIQGQLNGARLPWNYNFNLRIDRDIALSNKQGKRPLNLNVYLRVSNVLNTLNVRGVYAASGDPGNDGFLASSLGRLELSRYTDGNTISDQAIRELGRNVQNFMGFYEMGMLNPGFFFAPRRIYLGAIFEF